MVNPELDAQYAVLGSILIEPSITGEVLLTVNASDFREATCQTIFRAIQHLYIAGQRVDAVTVLHAAGEQYREYLSQLMDVTPTAAGWKEYARIMRERARVGRACDFAARLHPDMSEAEARTLAMKILEQFSDKSQKVLSLEDGYALFDSMQESPKTYLEFGFEPLDDGKLFAAKGDFIVLGARPSVGKTAIAVQMAQHMGRKHKVGFFSLETNAAKFFDRWIANSSGTSFSSIKRHELSEADWRCIAQAKHDTSGTIDFHFVDASGMTVDDIRVKTLAYQFDVIFIDYLQLISGSERDSYSRVTNISMGLHNLAQQANVAVIALAQLRRSNQSIDRKTGKPVECEPTLSDLRESGQIEQDADIAMLMFLDPKAPNRWNRDRILRIAKNKEGRLGEITLMFDGYRQRFDVREEEASSKIGQAEPQRPKIAEAEQIAMPDLRAGRKIY